MLRLSKSLGMTSRAGKTAGALAFCVSVALINGCSVPDDSVSYRCGESTLIDVYLESPTQISITDNDSTPLSLQAARAASGVKYVNGQVVWWEKGQSALYTDKDGVMHQCERLE